MTKKEDHKNKKTNNTKKKRIVIATDNFLPRIDGISKFLDMFIPMLSNKDNYIVDVIAPDFKGALNKDYNIKIHRVPLSLIKVGDYRLAKSPRKIKTLISSADLIFSQTTGPVGKKVISMAYKKNKNIISYIHAVDWILASRSISQLNLFKPIISYIVKLNSMLTYSKCNSLIVPSKDVASLLSFMGVKKPKYIVPLGVDTNEFKHKNKQEAKKRLGLSPDDFVIGYVGRIAREKGVITLSNAFSNIDHPQKRLLIVGDGIPSLKKRLVEKGAQITGAVPDVVKYLNAMDVFIMPSYTETSCLAALEAMSCKIPVIATEVGSMRDYITHKKTGYFFPKGNSTALSLRINYVIKHPEKAEEVAKNGRQIVLSSYNWEASSKKILKILSDHIR